MPSRTSAKSQGRPLDGKPIKRRLPPANPDFAHKVTQLRSEAGLSQTELAESAGISPRTQAQVEKAGTARAEVIIRIGAALERPLREWVVLAGHADVSDERIDEVVIERNREKIKPPFARIDPLLVFNRILDRVKKYEGALMCNFVTSPVAIDRPDIVDVFKKMFPLGFHLALICPFPNSEKNIGLERGYLNGYYAAAYQWTLELAENLRKAIPGIDERVSVFCPAQKESTILVQPPMRVSEVRPVFIKYGVPGGRGPQYELGAYLRYLDGRPDQWIEIYDGEKEESERAVGAFRVWRDYCSDIVESWNPKNDPIYDQQKLFFWQQKRGGRQ